jgi:hypothetical protein
VPEQVHDGAYAVVGSESAAKGNRRERLKRNETSDRGQEDDRMKRVMG